MTAIFAMSRTGIRRWADEFARAPVQYLDILQKIRTKLDSMPDGEGVDEDGMYAQVDIAASWHLCGRQSVIMPHRYAAALMATDPCLEFPPLPWDAFEIVVPNGLIRANDLGLAEAVYVRRYADDTVLILSVFERNCVMKLMSETGLIERTVNGIRRTPGAEEITDRRSSCRALTMLMRLVVNAMLDISSHPTSDCLPRTGRIPCKVDTHGRFVSTTTQIGRPLKLDCRREVQEYVSGVRRSEPKVTTLVRGHWRRQVHGPHSALRKLIWILPFYRGHGPLLVRPTLLGFGEHPHHGGAEAP